MIVVENRPLYNKLLDRLRKKRSPIRGEIQPRQAYKGKNNGCDTERKSRSTIGGGRGCRKFIPVLGDGTKIAPPGGIIDQPYSGMGCIRGKFADHVGDHVVLSPEGTVLVTSPGTESLYPLPPQSLNDSK